MYSYKWSWLTVVELSITYWCGHMTSRPTHDWWCERVRPSAASTPPAPSLSSPGPPVPCPSAAALETQTQHTCPQVLLPASHNHRIYYLSAKSLRFTTSNPKPQNLLPVSPNLQNLLPVSPNLQNLLPATQNHRIYYLQPKTTEFTTFQP